MAKKGRKSWKERKSGQKSFSRKAVQIHRVSYVWADTITTVFLLLHIIVNRKLEIMGLVESAISLQKFKTDVNRK